MATNPATRRGWLDEWVRVVRTSLEFVGECGLILWEAARRFWLRPREVGETVHQMAFIGASSVPLVALTCFCSGAVLALYSADLLAEYGASDLAGATIGFSVVRELAPVLAGIMVAARCGSAMAAQIGTMSVTEQIDALRALNVHPSNYLVIPRLIAGVSMLPVLALVGMYAGVLGGYLVATNLSGIPSGTFVQSLQEWLTLDDVFKGMAKTLVFGLIVPLVACQQGLRTRGGAVGVGKATTNTVVLTMVLVYVANFFLTAAMFR